MQLDAPEEPEDLNVKVKDTDNMPGSEGLINCALQLLTSQNTMDTPQAVMGGGTFVTDSASPILAAMEWALCMSFGAQSPELASFYDCIEDILDSRNPNGLTISVLTPAESALAKKTGAVKPAALASETSGGKRPKISIYTDDGGLGDVIDAWNCGDEVDKACACIMLATVLFHELIHGCGGDGHANPSADYCDPIHYATQAFSVFMAELYTDVMNSPCCSGYHTSLTTDSTSFEAGFSSECAKLCDPKPGFVLSNEFVVGGYA